MRYLFEVVSGKNSFWMVVAASLLAGDSLAVPIAELKQNYESIIARNPFGLKPPPPPPTNPPVVVPKPKTELFLTGITSIGHPRIPKRAYLKLQEQGPNKEPKYYELQEDQKRDDIAVLNIDERNNTVKVRTSEGDMLLSFKTHGVAPPPAGAPAPVPGQLQIPGRPGQAQAGVPTPLPGATAANIAPPPGSPTGYNPAVPTAMNAAYNARQIPTRSVRTRVPSTAIPGAAPGASMGLGAQPQAQPEPVDPAVQHINLKLQEEYARQQGIEFPPVPPLE